MVSAWNLWLRMCENEYRALPPAAHSQAQMPACIGPSWRKPERRVCRWLFYAICSIARTKRFFLSILNFAQSLCCPAPIMMTPAEWKTHHNLRHHRGSRGTGERGGRGPCRKIATVARALPPVKGGNAALAEAIHAWFARRRV